MKTIKFRFETLGEAHTEDIARAKRQFEQLEIIHRKQHYFYRWLQTHMPVELWDLVSVYFHDVGIGSQYLQIYADEVENEATTILIVDFMAKLGDGWAFKKNFDSDTGKFTYFASRMVGHSSYIIRFGDAANIDGCKVVKKRKMKTVYESDCES